MKVIINMMTFLRQSLNKTTPTSVPPMFTRHPCQGSCPSGEDIRGWLQIVRGIEQPPEDMSMSEYAFRRSTSANPFPSQMGRVLTPCQSGCTAKLMTTLG